MFLKREHLAVLPNSTSARTQSSKLIGSIALMLLVSLSAGSQVANASTSAGGYDGPAALPRVLIQTAMANTPTPGITTTVNSGENLQAALNNARCGDTIHLQAGASFTGPFTFPAKSCDANHWIVVRTSRRFLIACGRQPTYPMLCGSFFLAWPSCFSLRFHEERCGQIGDDRRPAAVRSSLLRAQTTIA